MKVGSLFTGYGGLDLALHMLFEGVETVWCSDIEPGPKAIIQKRMPGVPNLGDITQIDWETVPDVDVIVGGSPCQDLSNAGLRAGMKPDTRSGLWESMMYMVGALMPQMVVWENVLGACSANAYSRHGDLEQATGLLGDEPSGSVLRALGRVLGDLAEIGYSASWQSVRASDVGAPHARARVFVVAYPDRAGLEGYGQSRQLETEHAGFDGSERVFPHVDKWGDYTAAITRWEHVLGRPAPAPVEDGTDGRPRLSARFSEWLMGLPDGWVTDVDIPRALQLKALGNGCVPLQAAYAIHTLMRTPNLDEQEAAA